MLCATEEELFAGTHPDIAALAGGAGFPMSTASPSLPPGGAALRVGFSRSGGPGDGGRLRASVGKLDAEWTYTVSRPPVAVATALVRTATLYLDRSTTLIVAYSLAGEGGATQVERSDLRVRVALSWTTDCAGQSVSGGSSTFDCSATPSVDGVGDAHCSLPKSTFCGALGGRVAVVHLTAQYGASVAARAHAGLVDLRTARAEAAGPATTGMAMRLPRSARFTDDTFSVPVLANTGPAAFALHGWSVLVAYNTSALALVGQQFSPLYQAPTVSHRAPDGTLEAATTGLAASTADSDVRDARALPLATLTFRVVGEARAGTPARCVGVLRGTVLSMVNQGTQAYLADAPIVVSDDRAGAHAAGDLEIVPTLAAGRLAYWAGAEASNSLVNVASLGGAAATATARLYELSTRPERSSVAVGSGVGCVSDAPAVASALGGGGGGGECTLRVTSAHTEGGRVNVSMTAPSSSPPPPTTAGAAPPAAVPTLVATVWYPIAVEVRATDSRLGRVAGCGGGSGVPRFQQARLSAVATFGGAELAPVSGIDVSHLVTFHSTAPAVVGVAGRTASAVGDGAARIGLLAPLLASSTVVSSAQLVVSSSATVQIRAVQAAVVTAVEWSTTHATLEWSPPDSSVVASAFVAQRLSAEGAVGEVVAHVRFDDGTVWPLAADELHVRALSPSLDAAYADGAWRVTVARGAVRECGALVQASWAACERNASAIVVLDLPTATGLRASVSAARLAPPGDAATLAPLALASSARIHISVDFSDGTSRDFTDDARVATALASPAAGATSGCGAVAGTTVTVEGAASCDLLTVAVTAPSLGATLRALVTVAVVRLAALQPMAVPYPSFAGSSGVALSALRRLDCVDAYQHAQLRVLALLTDASHADVTAASAAATDSTGLLVERLSGSAGWRLRPSSVGAKSVVVSFGGHTATLALDALDASVAITALAVSAAGIRPSAGTTFGGERGDARAVQTRVAFADGTVFDDVYEAAAPAWFDPRDLVEHSSGDPRALTVEWAAGPAHPVVRLHNNSAARVPLRARSRCTPTVASELTVAPNLLPAEGDVDLGESEGVQFQQAGDALTVRVRANAADGVLVTYQIEVTFDDDVLRATSCDTGALNGFECTLNDPFDQVRLLATDTASRETGAATPLGAFTLRVTGSAVTLISGTIVELVRKLGSGGTEARTSDAPIVAGRGYASVSSPAGRRLRSGGAPPLALAAPSPRRPRRLQGGSCYEQTAASGVSCLAGFWCVHAHARRSRVQSAVGLSP